MYNFDIVPMRNKAGALIRGDNATSVFDEMKIALSDFYSELDMFFAAETISHKGHAAEVAFDSTRQRYKHKIYSDMPNVRESTQKVGNVTIDRKFPVGNPPLHGFLNVEYMGKEMHLGEIVLEWDFPQGRSSWTDENFGLYFDLVNKDVSVRKKECAQFIEYLLRN
jgi:hypothetical protein